MPFHAFLTCNRHFVAVTTCLGGLAGRCGTIWTLPRCRYSSTRTKKRNPWLLPRYLLILSFSPRASGHGGRRARNIVRASFEMLSSTAPHSERCFRKSTGLSGRLDASFRPLRPPPGHATRKLDSVPAIAGIAPGWAAALVGSP